MTRLLLSFLVTLHFIPNYEPQVPSPLPYLCHKYYCQLTYHPRQVKSPPTME